jgi:hypothetical protein
VGFIFGVTVVPGDFVQFACIRTCCACAGGVFPFGLCGQTVSKAVVAGIEAIQEFVSLILADGFNRPIIALDSARIGSHNRLPLGLCYFEFADLKGFCDLYMMYGTLVGVAIDVTDGTTHHELAGLDLDEGDPCVGVEFGRLRFRRQVLSDNYGCSQ